MNKTHVLLITGACGVGKTTLAKAWAKTKDGAIIECDYLTEWIHQKTFPHWTEKEEELTSNLVTVMALEYLKFGMPVAIENVWTPAALTTIKEKLEAKNAELNVQAVWLRCTRAENHRRDQQRIPDNQMRERVDIVTGELESYDWPDFVQEIDTTDKSVADTLEML